MLQVLDLVKLFLVDHLLHFLFIVMADYVCLSNIKKLRFFRYFGTSHFLYWLVLRCHQAIILGLLGGCGEVPDCFVIFM